MDFRADIYSAGRYRLTERYTAADLDEACDTARRLTVAHGHDRALVYICDGVGGATIAAEVEVDQ